MESIANELEMVIATHLPSLKLLDESRFAYKPSPSKWSKKEVIGHLVDSAQCNIRRFIMSQYEETPRIIYDQDRSVTISGYQHWNSNDLVDLWRLLNLQIGGILRNTSIETAQRQCMTEALHTIEWLAIDYIKHLKHHLHQVLEPDPVPYP
jgi:DinB superfamily